MLCPKCGNILDDSETSCKNCGAKVKRSSLGQSTETEAPKQEQVKQEPVETVETEETYYYPDDNMYEQNYQYDMSQDEYNSYNQGYGYQKKSGNGVLIIVIVLVCIVTIFVGFLAVKQLKGDDIKASKATGETGKNLEPSTSEKQGGTTVEFKGYNFTIPAHYTTKVDKELIISQDYENQVQLVFNVMTGITYNEVIAMKEDYKNYLNELGFSVESYNEVKYSNRQWLIYYGVLSGKDSLYAITAFGPSSAFQVTIFNFGSKTNNAIFAELDKIIESSGIDNMKEEPKQAEPETPPSGSSNVPPESGSGGSVIA